MPEPVTQESRRVTSKNPRITPQLHEKACAPYPKGVPADRAKPSEDVMISRK